MSKAKAVSTNKVKKSREDWIFDIILYTIGVLLIIITLYPMYFIVIASFSDPAAVSNGQIMLLVLYSSSFYRPSPRSLQLLGHSPFFTSSVGSTMIYKMLWIGFISPTT